MTDELPPDWRPEWRPPKRRRDPDAEPTMTVHNEAALARTRARARIEELPEPTGATYATLEALDAKLEASGVPPLSAWWRTEVARLYGPPGALLWVARVGRGGSKSTTAVKVALNEVLNGVWVIPPGERHRFAFVSENEDQAADRIGQLEKYLTIVGEPFARVGNTIELERLPRGVRVLVARIGSVSAFRCFGYLADEAAKWRSASTGANPAAEVITSMNGMCATHPNAKRMVFSSPMSKLDHHAELFARGNGNGQIVSCAASWVANPGAITEAETRLIERHEHRWRREYAAIPMEGTDASLIEPVAIDACTRRGEKILDRVDGHDYVAAMDPATRRNAWTLVVMTRRENDRKRIVRSIVRAEQWQATRDEPLNPERILERIRDVLALYGIAHCWTDQREYDSLRVIGARVGVTLQLDEQGTTANYRRYLSLANAIRDADLELPDDAQVRADLLGVYEHYTLQGTTTIRLAETPDGRHCDYAAALAMVIEKGCGDPVEQAYARPVDEEQAASFERARERYGAPKSVPWWKR